MRYLWACIITSLLFVLLACGASDQNEDANASPHKTVFRSYHEADFSDHPSLKATADDLVVMHLESSGTHENDSGGAGHDAFPRYYFEKTAHTYCLESGLGHAHEFKIKDAQDKELFSLKAGECKTVELDPGEYQEEIHHGAKGRDNADTMIFFQPMHAKSDQGRPFPDLDKTSEGALKASTSANCAYVNTVPYNTLALTEGQVALFTTSCNPSAVGGAQPANNTDPVMIFRGSCNDIGSAPITGYKLGSYTNAMIFQESGYQGIFHFAKNPSSASACIDWTPSQDGSGKGDVNTHSSSLALWKFGTLEANMCQVARAGYYCTCTNPPDWTPRLSNIAMPDKGEAMVFGGLGSATDNCCRPAVVFNGPCYDLSLVGFDENVIGVRVGLDTTLTVYEDASYQGLATTYDDPNGDKILITDPDGYHVSQRHTTSLWLGSYQTKNRWTLIHDTSCTYCDVSGMDFTNENLNSKILSHSNFSDCTMNGAHLENTDLTYAKFNGTHCVQCDMLGANLSNALLNKVVDANGNVVHNGADFSRSFMADVQLVGADLTGATLSNVNLFMLNVKPSLKSATIKDTKFISANLTDAIFDTSTIAGADFSGAILIGASFIGTNFTTKDNPTNPNDTSFNGATLYGVDFTNAPMMRVNLSNALFSPEPGNYNLTYIASWDPIQSNYVTESMVIAYAANIPNRLPTSTDNSVTCPNGGRGICNGNGGENAQNCSADCSQTPQCSRARHCIARPHTAATSTEMGHWECVSGACTFTSEANTSDDYGDALCRTCQGTSCTTKSGSCLCGDGFCDRYGGESAQTCGQDCTQAPECVVPMDCVAKHWPTADIGRWDCQNGTCTQLLTANACNYDGLCDTDGSWLAKDPPIYRGENNPDSW